MEEGDQFLKRFSDLAKVSEKWTTGERFGEPVNQKTLGVMTVSYNLSSAILFFVVGTNFIKSQMKMLYTCTDQFWLLGFLA